MRSFRVTLTTLLALLLISCGGAPPKPSLMANMANEEVSVTELRAVDYEFASRFSQLVAKCAMSIVDESDDPGTQEHALLWRMYASPQARTAAFNQDPLAGLIELWTLAGQQRAFFTEGDGKGAFGDHGACVTETVIQLEEEAKELAASFMPATTVENFGRRVDEWVAAHPIQGRLFVRPTAQADLASLVHSTGQTGLKAVGSMEETFRDLNDRLAILSVQMPLEARWQAEYLIHSIFEDQLSGPTDKMLASMDNISAFLNDFETTLGDQTTRLLDAFTVEREAAFTAIDEEREAILDAIEEERIALTDSFNAEVEQALARVEATTRDIIDHFFARLIGVLVGIGIFIIIIVAMLIGALRSRTPAVVPSSSSEAPKDD